MSMLSLQAEELREAAGKFEGYQNGEISRMLREAADTIEGLRDRMQAVDETCNIEWRGTVIETPWGEAKVYDSGCDDGVTDFYVAF